MGWLEVIGILVGGTVSIVTIVFQYMSRKDDRTRLQRAQEIAYKAMQNSIKMRDDIAHGRHYEVKGNADRIHSDLSALRGVLKKDLSAKP